MNRQSNNDPSTHFKMYKSGKKWVFAGLTAVTLLTATGAVAHADAGLTLLLQMESLQKPKAPPLAGQADAP